MKNPPKNTYVRARWGERWYQSLWTGQRWKRINLHGLEVADKPDSWEMYLKYDHGGRPY